jgi:hypothetical protein
VGNDSVSSAGSWGEAVATGVSAAAAGDPLIADAGLSFDHYTQIVYADTVHLFVQAGMTVS